MRTLNLPNRLIRQEYFFIRIFSPQQDMTRKNFVNLITTDFLGITLCASMSATDILEE